MDAFESVVGEILWREGYWVQPSLKVELTKEEKVAIGRPSSPRWELDLVGYSGKRNELLVVECKSYMDSYGVQYRAFTEANSTHSSRFKLFNEPKLWTVVRKRLCKQLLEQGLISGRPKVKLALVCGKIIRETDRKLLQRHFRKKGWQLWDEHWLAHKLKEMSQAGYENSQVPVVAKLILRSLTGDAKSDQ